MIVVKLFMCDPHDEDRNKSQLIHGRARVIQKWIYIIFQVLLYVWAYNK